MAKNDIQSEDPHDVILRTQPSLGPYLSHLLQGTNKLQNLENSIGFHGTSLGSLIEASQTGFIPRSKTPECEGVLFMFPTARMLQTDSTLKVASWSEAAERAKGYAIDSSRRYLGAMMAGIDMSTPDGWQLADDFFMDPDGALRPLVSDFFSLLSVSALEVRRIQTSIRSLERGFILAIGKEALSQGWERGFEEEGEIKVSVEPAGLPVSAILAVLPVSECDWNILHKLAGDTQQLNSLRLPRR